jgi:anti-sigma-K factor RskA
VFPDGTLLGRRWRWTVIAAAANAVIFVVMAVFPSETLRPEAGNHLHHSGRNSVVLRRLG